MTPHVADEEVGFRGGDRGHAAALVPGQRDTTYYSWLSSDNDPQPLVLSALPEVTVERPPPETQGMARRGLSFASSCFAQLLC